MCRCVDITIYCCIFDIFISTVGDISAGVFACGCQDTNPSRLGPNLKTVQLEAWTGCAEISVEDKCTAFIVGPAVIMTAQQCTHLTLSIPHQRGSTHIGKSLDFCRCSPQDNRYTCDGQSTLSVYVQLTDVAGKEP